MEGSNNCHKSTTLRRLNIHHRAVSDHTAAELHAGNTQQLHTGMLQLICSSVGHKSQMCQAKCVHGTCSCYPRSVFIRYKSQRQTCRPSTPLNDRQPAMTVPSSSTEVPPTGEKKPKNNTFTDSCSVGVSPVHV